MFLRYLLNVSIYSEIIRGGVVFYLDSLLGYISWGFICLNKSQRGYLGEPRVAGARAEKEQRHPATLHIELNLGQCALLTVPRRVLCISKRNVSSMWQK